MSGLATRIDKLEALAQLNNQNLPGSFVEVGTIAVPNTSIVNRAQIPDLANDCGVRFGINRILTQNGFLLQNEFGPNGEPVYGVLNDDRNLIRLVGGWALGNVGNFGVMNWGNAVNDYVEVTFYGTGLNWLTYANNSTSQAVVSIDGGAESANVMVTQSAVLTGRNYSPYVVVNLASGLSLGIHTVKLRLSVIVGNALNTYGFEILNTNSTTFLDIRPGVVFGNNAKVTIPSTVTSTYNSGFESGTLGTRGGRVLVYGKSDGTVGKAVQPVDVASAFLTSANHANEEVVRTYSPREFGAGRTDDFSRMTSTAIAAAFTLDDGTTTLVSDLCLSSIIGGYDSIAAANNNGFITFTFVGTGVDIARIDNGSGTDIWKYSIDGSTPANIGQTAVNGVLRIEKIVSGLPYGTHTLRIIRPASAVYTVTIARFIVYGPKKPTIPTGAVELADYNIMADYVVSSSAVTGFVTTGVLRKMGTRENLYTGTWVLPSTDAGNFEQGFNLNTVTSASSFQYTFFGTGVEYRTFFQAVAYNLSITIDGASNLSGFTTSIIQPGTGLSFTAATGVVSGTSSSANNGRVIISGLPLGLHTIRIQTNNTALVYADAFDIITPIHSPKSNLYGDLQNTLTVGNNSIGDSRRFSSTSQKAWAQAVGLASVTNSATTYVPMADMSLVIKTNGGAVQISYSLEVTNNQATGAGTTFTTVVVDGQTIGVPKVQDTPNASSTIVFMGDTFIVPLSAGVHKIDLYWRTSGGTSTVLGSRNINVREL